MNIASRARCTSATTAGKVRAAAPAAAARRPATTTTRRAAAALDKDSGFTYSWHRRGQREGPGQRGRPVAARASRGPWWRGRGQGQPQRAQRRARPALRRRLGRCPGGTCRAECAPLRRPSRHVTQLAARGEAGGEPQTHGPLPRLAAARQRQVHS